MGLLTILDIASVLVILIVFILVSRGLSAVLKLRPEPISFENPKKEAVLACRMTAVILIATCALEIFRNTVYQPYFQLDKRPPFTVGIHDVLFAGFFYSVWICLLLIVAGRSVKNLEAVGIGRMRIGRMCVFGLLLGAIYFTGAGFFASDGVGTFTGSMSSLVYGLVLNVIIGFVEEMVWRGYIQTRLAAYAGPLKGLLVTSGLFALLHLPSRYYLYSGAVLDALISTFLVSAAGLLFGYTMLKSQSIIPGSILHAISNWSALFWRILPF